MTDMFNAEKCRMLKVNVNNSVEMATSFDVDSQRHKTGDRDCEQRTSFKARLCGSLTWCFSKLCQEGSRNTRELDPSRYSPTRFITVSGKEPDPVPPTNRFFPTRKFTQKSSKKV